MRYYLRALVEDKPGVLARVAGQMARRNINIEYFIARSLPDQGRTGIIVGFDADEHLADRMAKSIAKLINILEVTCRTSDPSEDLPPIATDTGEGKTPGTKRNALLSDNNHIHGSLPVIGHWRHGAALQAYRSDAAEHP